MSKRYESIITYGTFDLFHIGHLRLLQRLDALADRLIVGVSTDEFNALKGKRCLIPYAQRAEIVANLRQVDLVIPENCWEQKVDDIKKHAVSAFAMGDDWRGRFDELKAHCEVIYLDRTEGVSTTEIKTSLAALDKEKILLIKQALEIASIMAEDFR